MWWMVRETRFDVAAFVPLPQVRDGPRGSVIVWATNVDKINLESLFSFFFFLFFPFFFPFFPFFSLLFSFFFFFSPLSSTFQFSLTFFPPRTALNWAFDHGEILLLLSGPITMVGQGMVF